MAEHDAVAAATDEFPPGTPQWRHTTSLPFFFPHLRTPTAAQRALPESCGGLQCMFEQVAHPLCTQVHSAAHAAQCDGASASTPQRVNERDVGAGGGTRLRTQMKARFKLVERKREGGTREATWQRLLDWLAWNVEPTYRRVMQTLTDALDEEQGTAHDEPSRAVPHSLRFDRFDYSPNQHILLTPKNAADSTSAPCCREPHRRSAKRVRFGPSLCLDGSDLRRLISVPHEHTLDLSRRKRPRAAYVFRVQGSNVVHIGGSRPLPAPFPSPHAAARTDRDHALASVFSMPPLPLPAPTHPPPHIQHPLPNIHASSDLAPSRAPSDGCSADDMLPTRWSVRTPSLGRRDAANDAVELDFPSTQPIHPHLAPRLHFCIPSPSSQNLPLPHNAATNDARVRESSTLPMLHPCNDLHNTSPCSSPATSFAAPQLNARLPLAELNARDMATEQCTSKGYQRLPPYRCSQSPPANPQRVSRSTKPLFGIKGEAASPRMSDGAPDALGVWGASRCDHASTHAACVAPPHPDPLLSCPCPMLSNVSLPSFASSSGQRIYTLSDAFVKHTGTLEHPVLKQVALLGRCSSSLVSQAPDVILARYLLEMSNYVDEKTYGKLVHSLCKLWRKLAADALDKENAQPPARSVRTTCAQQVHTAAGRLLDKEHARMAARQRRTLSSVHSTLQHLRCWLVTHDYLELPSAALLPTCLGLPR